MKYSMALLITTLMTSGPVTADDGFNDIEKDFCTRYSWIAEAVMTARQGGMTMREMMAVDGADSDAAMLIIPLAYEIPAYETESLQQEAIKEFSNMFYLECYEALKD